ncbi:MAG: hypothetical protein MRJ92_00730 [Nitrospira sp.]|nr:hypothetical protein [Nitrospira sp.]
MKIRKKFPKPAPAKLPLYVIGYRGIPPRRRPPVWCTTSTGNTPVDRPPPDGRLPTVHGALHVLASLAETEALHWQFVLTWDHQQLGVVSPSASSPGNRGDTVLVAARLARGLTLLTDGTAFDVACHEYLNPSDWNDRPLTVFVTRDHVTVHHQETDDAGSDWYYTLGLTKFGLDELELIQPRGLPEADAIALLESAADEVLRIGHNQRSALR